MNGKKCEKEKRNYTDNIKYNPIWADEYKMMREELVIYMEKLQAVRNMMYITIGAIFAFSISTELPFLCVLLPLLFILPSYVTAVNYWVCVRKASAYLVVFHESYEDCPIHWESRHNMLKKMNNKQESFKKSTYRNVPSQLIPYYACAAITMIVYILRLYKYVSEKMTNGTMTAFLDISIDNISILGYIIVGIIITICLVVFFIRFSMGESYVSFIKKFLLIRNGEGQSEIGKYWLDGRFDEGDGEYLREISKMLNKYL